MKIKKAVIPAAGLGTRFLPATKAIAKEMLPIVDKPCIQYLVEEAVRSGIKEIIFILGKDGQAIRKHFSPSKYLGSELRRRKKLPLLRALQKIEKLAKFHYVTQASPQGDGHAILRAKKFIKNEPFAVLFGDDIYDSKVPALAQLIKVFRGNPVIALTKIPGKDAHKYGIAKLKGRQVTGLVEKPKSYQTPVELAITGKYIVTPELFKTLEKSRPGKDHELRLIDGMKNFIKHSKIHGHILKGQRFDTGDKLGYLKAVIHFGFKESKFRQALKTLTRGY